MQSDGTNGEPMDARMGRLEAGDASTAEWFYRRYGARVCKLAEQKIGQRLQSRFDAEDIMQSALGSFFRRAANGEFHCDHSGALWNLLTTITLNKIRRQANIHRAKKRDVAAEAEVDVHQLEFEASGLGAASQVEDATILADAVEAVISRLDSRDVEFFQLKYREGLSSMEISSRTGWSVATVNRVLNRIVGRIRRHFEDDCHS